jgi:hypothetical protein
LRRDGYRCIITKIQNDPREEESMARTTERTGGGRSGSRTRRKNLNIDQTKLDRVKRALGAKTETEAVDAALSLVLFREDLVEGIRRISGTGGVENVFSGDEEP